jgi:MFS family permease
MPDVAGPPGAAEPPRPSPGAAEAKLAAPAVRRAGWGFIALFAAAYLGATLQLLAPLVVTLALKVDSLVGSARAPNSLALVTGVGAFLALFANPFFGKLSDRTAGRYGMRRPWIVGGLLGGFVGLLVIAVAPTLPVVLLGWCLAQLLFNAMLAAIVAVLPDQIPSSQRGLVSGILGICLPVAAVTGTFLVQLFTGNSVAMFLAPSAIGGFFVVLFAVTLHDRRLAAADRPAWSWREFAGTFYVSPRKNPDFGWAFASRFLFVLAYAFLVTYLAFYLLEQLGSAKSDVPRQIFTGTVVQAVFIVAASLLGGPLSDRTGRRKVFVVTASVVYGLAMFAVAVAADFNGFLVGMAISGLGFGLYMAVDLALVADVLTGADTAKELGVFNVANALPFSIAPAMASAVLAVSGGSYGALYVVAGVCAFAGAAAILPVRRVR